MKLGKLNLKKLLLIDILLVFGAYSGWVMWNIGYFGIWQSGLATPGSAQVLADLVICALLICAWMLQDARSRGGNAWPYVALTLCAGAFGPLLYLLVGAGRAVLTSRPA